MKLKDAVNAGYTRCSVCRSPRMSEIVRAGAATKGSQVSEQKESRAAGKETPTGETTATGKPIYVGSRGRSLSLR